MTEALKVTGLPQELQQKYDNLPPIYNTDGQYYLGRNLDPLKNNKRDWFYIGALIAAPAIVERFGVLAVIGASMALAIETNIRELRRSISERR